MNIHEHQAKQILKKYGVVVPKGVFAFTVDELIEKVKSLKTFFSNSSNVNTASNLIKELNVTDFKTSKSGIFYGKTIMFTGGLSKMSRAEAKALVEKEGGKIIGTASKKLDYLVVGDSKPTSKKVEKAKQLNIKILDENSWHGLLNRWTGIN